ncbi:hypothetical protein E1B28_013589 [Marasmius oreades]|uniref:Uncharacterized protein n=1 Tax=Marasmius oreades TaxID=181124 RepID=A0A9P7RPV8_9AGAR|nr:uncharacterized protein E1B28_013589 [Marasmius oreades]KAG7087641.1 hypothetical protein E1B28_013589 [Marasmius oreades]
MPTLPFELQTLILLHLRDSSSNFRGYSSILTVCALVCRAWVSSSRSALFHRFVLDDNSVGEFLQLYDHPLETFSLARVTQFEYQQCEVRNRDYLQDPTSSCDTLNKVLKWRSSDGKRDLSTMLSVTERMELGYFGWDTLDGKGKRRLAECFSSIQHLKLYGTEFESGDALQSFIKSFSALGSLHLDDVVLMAGSRAPVGKQTETWSHDDIPINLHTIVLEQMSRRDGTDVVESLTPCPSLRNFSYHHYFDVNGLTTSRTTAIGKLLASAAQTLEQLTVTVWRQGEESQIENAFRAIDISLNPNLRRINLSVQSSAYLIPFLERFTLAITKANGHGSYTPEPEEPCLHSLHIEHLPKLDINWERLDNTLQHPIFSALREINCEMKFRDRCRDSYGDTKSLLTISEEVYKGVKDFRARLPQCDSRGILKVVVKYDQL